MSQITKEQKEIFDALHDSRVEDYKVFSKKDYGGLFRSVVDKYPDSAHFVYELLQNADDANATEVYIILKQDRLIFKHNGTKHFDVTPLDAEEVGDINSITGIGNSSKTGNSLDTQNKIGKFGVGFKSVFQYTDTPEIYDDTFCFKIENFIIPTLIEEIKTDRKQGETMFVFHFPEDKRQRAHKEIHDKLEKLQNPILFLRHLQKIVWRIDPNNEIIGKEFSYEKKCLEKTKYNDITFERYYLTEPQNNNTLFLFSREITITDETNKQNSHLIYVGFYYDTEKKRLDTTSNDRKIYCFFPTKDSFKTCFISHAPFLLTDNRQNLKQGESLNEDLVNLLARLASESIVFLRDYGGKINNRLIDENITQIIPEYHRNSVWQFNELFEQPIINAFNYMLKKEPLFLSRDNKYIVPTQAYTTHNGIYELLDSTQFRKLRNGANVDFLKWELARNVLSRQDKEHKEFNCCKFFESVRRYDIVDFGRDITEEFMSEMNFDWVIKFYNFLREHAAAHINITNQSKGGELVFRNAPIIKTQRDNWVRPFNNNTEPNVYLPIEGSKYISSEYNFVNTTYLKNIFAQKLFAQLELKMPDEYDYIRNIVLEKYREDEEGSVEVDDDILKSDFQVFLSYYHKVKGNKEEDDFVNLLKERLYLVATDNALHKPSEIYFKTDILADYFGDDAVFFNMSFYKESVHDYKQSFVNDFLLNLGLSTLPKLLSTSVQHLRSVPHEIKVLFPIDKRDYYNDVVVEDKELDGFRNACQNERISKEVSIFLWNEVLNGIFTHQIDVDSFDSKCIVKASTQRRSTYDYYSCDLKILRELKQYPWIYNKEGDLCFSEDIVTEDLLPDYKTNVIIEVLNIQKRTRDLTKIGATDDEQKKYEIGVRAEQELDDDFTEEDMWAAVREAKAKKKKEKAAKLKAIESSKTTENIYDLDSLATNKSNCIKDENIEEKLEKRWEEKKNRHVNKPHSSTSPGDEMLFENSSKGIEVPDNDAPFFNSQNTSPSSSEKNIDDTTRAEKNLKAKDTSAKSQAETAKDMVDMMDLLNQTQKYTFKWFKIIMELMHDGQDKITERRVQIDFSKYELICSDKIVHLIEPTRPVPTWICDAEKFSIVALSNGKTAKIDGLIVKTTDDSIDISVELNDKMLNDLNKAKKIRVDAVDNTNIINSLETRFLQLEKEDDFDMNANLPQNISFIYGPPGTGKTTELVKRVHDLLEKEPNAKILVLTPTNKAADVVAIKMSNDDVCEGGLARYGATESLYLIEEMGCVTNRDTTDMNGWHNIVVATAARYAYDFVQPDDTAICDYPWDYIFIDEASMIDILTITYILYKGANAKQIIISGDPKQIQPVVQNDIPAYNIYNMVGLQGFASAIFDYKRYPVEGLMMQHRSIPVIGDMVSNFAYDGLVDSDPKRAPMKPLKLDGIPIKNVNFFGFDVAELDDIKGLNTVNNSAFNLYSVIFTYNMIEYTVKQIEKNHPNQEYSIGVVCAYRAQSDAIKNMLENRPLDTVSCKVTCGTVHSFQGDECDIMFIVLNPPEECTSGTHVNNENIINVAMSRARDYLFFVLPNGQPKGFFMKNRIGHVLPKTGTAIIKCKDVEKVIFNGNDNYIYENTHVTCHMPVNIYCEVNAVYEVKMSETAIDIKITPHE